MFWVLILKTSIYELHISDECIHWRSTVWFPPIMEILMYWFPSVRPVLTSTVTGSTQPGSDNTHTVSQSITWTERMHTHCKYCSGLFSALYHYVSVVWPNFPILIEVISNPDNKTCCYSLLKPFILCVNQLHFQWKHFFPSIDLVWLFNFSKTSSIAV